MALSPNNPVLTQHGRDRDGRVLLLLLLYAEVHTKYVCDVFMVSLLEIVRFRSNTVLTAFQ